jgi:hypothetical protein
MGPLLRDYARRFYDAFEPSHQLLAPLMLSVLAQRERLIYGPS